MLLLSNGRGRGQEMDGRYRDGYEPEGRYRDGYEPEGRFRDRRGREHYDNGRYAPQNAGDSWIESRQGRDSHGRFTGVYGGSGEMDGGSPQMRHFPAYPDQPYYDRGDYGRDRYSRPVSRIGFSVDGEMERLPREFDEDFRADEMAHRSGSGRVRGHGASETARPFDRQTAEQWVARMQNTDGSTGQHWSFEQAGQIMAQKKIDCDPVQFYAALNAVYSDFYTVAKKYGVSNIEFFADLAKAWLDDKDAVPDKLAAYYQYVVKH